MKTIEIIVCGGIITDIKKNFNKKIKVIIKDYDIDGISQEKLKKDENGTLFLESISEI